MRSPRYLQCALEETEAAGLEPCAILACRLDQPRLFSTRPTGDSLCLVFEPGLLKSFLASGAPETGSRLRQQKLLQQRSLLEKKVQRLSMDLAAALAREKILGKGLIQPENSLGACTGKPARS